MKSVKRNGDAVTKDDVLAAISREVDHLANLMPRGGNSQMEHDQLKN